MNDSDLKNPSKQSKAACENFAAVTGTPFAANAKTTLKHGIEATTNTTKWNLPAPIEIFESHDPQSRYQNTDSHKKADLSNLANSWFRAPSLARYRARRALLNENGAATAEYAVATMAAVAFAGLLVVIMRSDEVRGILTDLVRRALTVE